MFRDLKDAWTEWREKSVQFRIVSAMLVLFVLLAFAICVSQSPVAPAF